MYMVHVGEVVHKYGNHDLVSAAGSAAGRDGAGTLVGCFINASNGFLTFTLNGRDLPNKFQVEPGTRLFPAVIYEPTCADNLHFEIGRTKVSHTGCSEITDNNCSQGGGHFQEKYPPGSSVKPKQTP